MGSFELCFGERQRLVDVLAESGVQMEKSLCLLFCEHLGVGCGKSFRHFSSDKVGGCPSVVD